MQTQRGRAAGGEADAVGGQGGQQRKLGARRDTRQLPGRRGRVGRWGHSGTRCTQAARATSAGCPLPCSARQRRWGKSQGSWPCRRRCRPRARRGPAGLGGPTNASACERRGEAAPWLPSSLTWPWQAGPHRHRQDRSKQISAPERPAAHLDVVHGGEAVVVAVVAAEGGSIN